MDTKVGALSPWEWVSLCFLLGEESELAIDGKALPSTVPFVGLTVDFTVGIRLRFFCEQSVFRL